MNSRAQLGALFESRRKVTAQLMLAVGGVGLVVGAIIGYIMMGTLHAAVEMGVETHYADGATPSSQSVQSGVGRTTLLGTVGNSKSTLVSSGARGTEVHTLCTSNGSPYQNFQNRIMYGTYKIVQRMPGGEKLVGFTRILHRTADDELMQEIPTFRAKPLTPKCDGWCEFPVADRPNAVRQFFDAVRQSPSMVTAPWILMIETDYVWMKPLAGVPPADSNANGWGFSFGYIVPTFPGIEHVMRKLFPASNGPLKLVPTTGPAPVLLRLADWQKVTPEWERLTAEIEGDPDSKEKLGWVREMYAFSIACALKGVKLDLSLPPKGPLIAQPPADHVIGDAAMLHYTWGSIFKDKDGKEGWKFDKRFYTSKEVARKVPRLPEPPPFDAAAGETLQDGVKVTKELHALLTDMIRRMNEGSTGLPAL